VELRKKCKGIGRRYKAVKEDEKMIPREIRNVFGKGHKQKTNNRKLFVTFNKLKDTLKINSISLQNWKYRIGNSGKEISQRNKHWRVKFEKTRVSCYSLCREPNGEQGWQIEPLSVKQRADMSIHAIHIEIIRLRM
jgi:hypothetical protein